MARNEKTPTKVVRVRKLAWYVFILFFYFSLFLFLEENNLTLPIPHRFNSSLAAYFYHFMTKLPVRMQLTQLRTF